MSASGIIERTINNGILILTRSSFEEPLPKRYASDMCPTANEAVFLL
jgi:hypothetical protein